MSETPELRIRTLNDVEPRADGDFVLYWMIANRRGHYNFSLQRAAEWAKRLNKPLVILEALRCGYQWASDRIHQFVIEGMSDNAAHFEKKNALYYPYLESKRGDGDGLLEALASRACVVTSDDFPAFFLPRMLNVARRKVTVRFEVIDSNGLLPMRAADKVFSRAYDFRRFLQKNLLPHLIDVPKPDPLSRVKLPPISRLPKEIQKRWPKAEITAITDSQLLGSIAIDHSVRSVSTRGGEKAAISSLRTFLKSRLSIYDSDRNQPEQEATSGLSPYLHFGHISAHQIFEELTTLAEWTPDLVAEKAKGSSSGWWGAAAEVESFLDELITWRELGYNMCWQRDDYDRYDSLPDWAQKTLAEHAGDRRSHVYNLDEFETSKTHDPLWNAAQRQTGTRRPNSQLSSHAVGKENS